MSLLKNNSSIIYLIISFLVFANLGTTFASKTIHLNDSTNSSDPLNQSDNLVPNNISEFSYWSTYLGGSGSEYSHQTSVDSKDDIVVVGGTESINFPTLNAYDSTLNAEAYYCDAFITKYNSSGSLLWSTYMGGSRWDSAHSIAFDSSDNIIVGGETSSSNFPVLNFNTELNGVSDGFIAKFNPSGELLWSRYFGGSDGGYIEAVEVDSNNDIIVTGITSSEDFPVLNSYDETYNGDFDVFVSKFNSTGNLIWSTYLGGSKPESGHSLSIDSSNDIVVTGFTISENFPAVSAYDDAYGGGWDDAFLAKFSSAGNLEWSTFLGGNKSDIAFSTAIDSQNKILVTGYTMSYDFPSINSFQENKSLSEDCFISKFSSLGELEWSTYLGGKDDDWCMSVTVDSKDEVIITGKTESSNFITLNAFDSSYNEAMDTFIAKFSSFGELVYSTFLGGLSSDSGWSIVLDSLGDIIISGRTSSDDFPIINAYDSSHNGLLDVYLSKLFPVFAFPDNDAINGDSIEDSSDAPIASFIYVISSIAVILIYSRKSSS